MKILITFLFLGLSVHIAFGQDNPYKVFGYKTKTEYKDNPRDVYKVNNADKNSNIKYLIFDRQNKTIKLINDRDSVTQTIPYTDQDLLRWVSVDPKAEKYPQLSPYNYVNNNPLNNIDPNGAEIVGTDGKAVSYSVNKSGNVSWSKNASADVRSYGNALIAVGNKGSLDVLVNNDIKTHINISSAAKDDGTTITYGETVQGNNNASDNFGKVVNEDGTYGIKEATITIYGGSIDNAIKDGSGTKLEGLTKQQALGAVASHEDVHASNKAEINKDLKYEFANPGKARPNKEVKPNQVEQKIIDAQKKKNAQQ